ncbi:type II toxin-antitoxin system RelE/ParE family toxin [Aliirhizobium smilacinae]|uniref:Type II toxin-antitoxin system RelE/ParE family toxin n=1 Tax=Aliirhizobium smilacinae TaxID=1395944 RepID=A0A5C4XPZ5_9HYPH|nr:type II toxin-antitoxin system RelE/ParE family toxin [Rhizobium smilacinae]TNM65555.1 type II toxin-antitoxin system RelE/ParE family toxin [Rhizobium smilacinae]
MTKSGKQSKRLIVSPLARTDLRGIRRFISETSPFYAREFLRDLTAKISWIAQADFTGSPRDHISPGLRALPYRRLCIYYRYYADRIVILRVMHMVQDVKREDFE